MKFERRDSNPVRFSAFVGKQQPDGALAGEIGPVCALDILRVVLDEGIGLGGEGDVFEGDVFGVGTGDAVGAGEVEVGEGHVLDGALLQAFDHAAVPGVAGGDVVDVDIAKDGAAFREGFNGVLV